MKRLIPLVFAVLPLLIALAAFAVTAKATPIYTDLPFPSEFPAEHIVELPKYDSKTQQLHAEAWIYACSLSRYDCKGLAAPIVVYEDMTDEPGLLGRYWRGARVISLNEELRGVDDGRVLVRRELGDRQHSCRDQRDGCCGHNRRAPCGATFRCAWRIERDGWC